MRYYNNKHQLTDRAANAVPDTVVISFSLRSKVRRFGSIVGVEIEVKSFEDKSRLRSEGIDSNASYPLDSLLFRKLIV